MDTVLPGRSPEAEDAFVAAWSAAEGDDGLTEAIAAALRDRRPQLAARLVGLLDRHVEIAPGSPLERAQRAAGLVLHAAPDAAEHSWSELEDAWADVHRERFRRMKSRMRAALDGRGEIPRRGSKPKRR